jgi:hypothetical protein
MPETASKSTSCCDDDDSDKDAHRSVPHFVPSTPTRGDCGSCNVPPNKSELLRRDHSLLLRKGRAMDLSEQQVREISKWAQRAAPYVETVHLFGSRAKRLRSAR